MNKNTNILIVGLGLIGGSYAQGLSSKGFKVYAIDKNEDALKYGREHGFIMDSELKEDELVKKADLIILSLYPTDNVKWVENHHHLFSSDTLITDVSGIKMAIVNKIQSIIQKGEFIASHPMAGKEKSGVEYASASIFKDANFLITPTSINSQKAIDAIHDLAEALEFANIEIISPQLHDEMIGYLSQLTHVIAISLMNTHDNVEHLIRYTGDSFRDLTRIAKINENLWSELFILNKKILSSNIDNFINEMNEFKKILDDEDIEAMKKKMILSTERRKMFDRK